MDADFVLGDGVPPPRTAAGSEEEGDGRILSRGKKTKRARGAGSAETVKSGRKERKGKKERSITSIVLQESR